MVYFVIDEISENNKKHLPPSVSDGKEKNNFHDDSIFKDA